jgi:hypothetical protein
MTPASPATILVQLPHIRTDVSDEEVEEVFAVANEVASPLNEVRTMRTPEYPEKGHLGHRWKRG